MKKLTKEDLRAIYMNLHAQCADECEAIAWADKMVEGRIDGLFDFLQTAKTFTVVTEWMTKGEREEGRIDPLSLEELRRLLILESRQSTSDLLFGFNMLLTGMELASRGYNYKTEKVQ